MKYKSLFSAYLIVCLLSLSSPLYAKKAEPELSPGYAFQFKKIPQHAWNDVKYSLWGWEGLGLVAGLGVTAAFHPLDNNLSNTLSDHPLFGKKADDIIGIVFSPYTYTGASFLTFLISNKSKYSKLTLSMESLTEASLFSMALVGAGKIAIRRERPNGGNYSLPSGHSAAAFSGAAVLTEFYGVPAAIPSYALATLVSLSRLDGHVHYLTDVMAGAVLGTAVGLGTSLAHKHETMDFLLLPQASSHEAGIVFQKNF